MTKSIKQLFSTLLLLLLIPLITIGCVEEEETPDDSCTVSESMLERRFTKLVTAGDKISQQITLYGATTLTAVKVSMSSNLLTTASLKIYESTGGDPGTGNLVATSSNGAPLGSASPEDLVTFNFPAGVSLWSGSDYNFIIEGDNDFVIYYYVPLGGVNMYSQAGIDSYSQAGDSWSLYSASGFITASYIQDCSGQ